MAGSKSSWPHLDKARSREVAIEREDLGQPSPAHQREARGIHERVLPLVAAVEPPPRFFLDIDWNVNDIDGLRPGDEVTSPARRGVTVTPSEERPDLTENMVAHEQGLIARLPQVPRRLVVAGAP